MDFTAVCRTCLGNTTLHPLFSTEDYSRDIYLITGVKVECDDGLPQYICSNCKHFLNNVNKFKNQCRAAEEQLLKIQNDIWYTKYTEQHVPRIKEESNEFVNIYDADIEIKNSELDEDEKPLNYFIQTEDSCNQTKTDNIHKITEVVVKIENTDSELDIEDTSHNEFNKVHSSEEIVNTEEDLTNTNCKNKDETDPKRVICEICQKDLSVRSIDKHMDNCHPGSNDRKVKCELCDTYVFKFKLMRHISIRHPVGHNSCVHCESKFDSKQKLIDHIATCTKKIKRKRKVYEADREMMECDVCHQTMQKASLRMHKAVKHAGLGPVCEHCGRRFGNKLRLNEHYRAKHGYEKLKCSHCNFQTSGLVSLRNHELQHRGEKPYVCEQCGARFHASYLLAQHRQSHRTEKLFKCDQCPARFKANNSLHMHKSACHSSARYGCGVCSRTYSCRQYAARHVRAVHRRDGLAATSLPLQLPPIVGGSCEESAC